jgi:hypothetical protein
MFIITQMFYEKFEDTKPVIRIRKLKKNRQHNGQKIKEKSVNNYLQNTIQRTYDRATRTSQKPGVNWGAPERYAVHVPQVAPVVLPWLKTQWKVMGEKRNEYVVTTTNSVVCVYLNRRG